MSPATRSRTLGAVSPADFDRLAQLRRMKAVALGLLIAMAVIFIVSFVLQEKYAGFAYVRAASEGGMVGAIADWFAVTALFRYPLGLKIPHTNIIAARKDEIGTGLGSFIDDNFLSEEVVREKLSSLSVAQIAASWIATPGNPERIAGAGATGMLGVLTVLDDSDIRSLVENLVRRHMVEPDWAPTLSRVATSFVDSGHHRMLIDVAADRLTAWLETHPEAFDRVVSARLPSWVPGMVNRFVDDRAHAEALGFLRAVREDREHPFRIAADRFLGEFARDLAEKPDLAARVESMKSEVFDSPRIRSLAGSAWDGARTALEAMLRDPDGELRRGLAQAVADLGEKLGSDAALAAKIDGWTTEAVASLVDTYRHDIANVVVETVERWDATEAAEKIELQVGKDLQYIRINGTVVGSLAGLLIYSLAHNLLLPLFF